MMDKQWHRIVRQHSEDDPQRVKRFQAYRRTLMGEDKACKREIRRGAQWLAFQLEFYDEPNQERIDF
jgi:hypothetical protein